MGGTYEWKNGGRDGDGAGPLDAGVFVQGKWMMTEREIYATRSDGNYDTGLACALGAGPGAVPPGAYCQTRRLGPVLFS